MACLTFSFHMKEKAEGCKHTILLEGKVDIYWMIKNGDSLVLNVMIMHPFQWHVVSYIRSTWSVCF